MHDQLFANANKLDEAFYLESAAALGLDKTAFAACLENPQPRLQVQSDLAYGNRIGVSGTPRFYVGKRNGDNITQVAMISGAQRYGAFKGALINLGLKLDPGPPPQKP